MALRSNRSDVKTIALQEMDKITAEGGSLPSLVVLDLDYTLWPFWCECKQKNSTPYLYPESEPLLEALRDRGVLLAVASRTPTPDIASSFLHKLNLSSTFQFKEIYPSFTHKTDHFKAIQRSSDVPYKKMLFFDDEDRNIHTVGRLGVTSILVQDGFCLEALMLGLRAFNGQPGVHQGLDGSSVDHL